MKFYSLEEIKKLKTLLQTKINDLKKSGTKGKITILSIKDLGEEDESTARRFSLKVEINLENSSNTWQQDILVSIYPENINLVQNNMRRPILINPNDPSFMLIQWNNETYEPIVYQP
jgi:hypothetical protein